MDSAGAPLGLDPDTSCQATGQGRARPRRHDARPDRQDLLQRPPPAVRDPSRRPRAPRIDPKPILDGWKLLESTEAYRAKGKNALFGADAEEPSDRPDHADEQGDADPPLLDDRRIEVYGCGRGRHPRAGAIDRRVLATLAFLASSGLKPTVSSLRCGHGLMTASGNVSEHSTGHGARPCPDQRRVALYGHQGPGSIADVTIQRLLTLQGTMKPHQIISLMTFDGADNTFAMADHADHIHIGWRPLYGDQPPPPRARSTPS